MKTTVFLLNALVTLACSVAAGFFVYRMYQSPRWALAAILVLMLILAGAGFEWLEKAAGLHFGDDSE